MKVISKGSLRGHRGSLCTVCHLSVGYRKTNSEDLGPVYKKGGLPSKQVNPSWRAKDSPGLQVKFHR